MNDHTLRVAEHFLSIQGEGKTAGARSVFLRLQGCNLMCGGAGTESDKQLHNGAKWRCDTIEVWTKGTRYPVPELLKLFEVKNYTAAIESGAHLVITGGEPLLQQFGITEFLIALRTIVGKNIFVEIETNGTLMPSDMLDSLVTQYNVSPKLKNSGMNTDKRFRAALIALAMSPKSIFKFVVSDSDDVAEVESDFLDMIRFNPDSVFLMPGASTRSELLSKEKEIAAEALRLGVNFSSRLQLHIWDQATGV